MRNRTGYSPCRKLVGTLQSTISVRCDDTSEYVKPYHSYAMPLLTASLGYIMDGQPFDVRSFAPANLAPAVLPDLLSG